MESRRKPGWLVLARRPKQIRQGGPQRESPVQWKANNAAPLADFGGFEMVSNFPADELDVVGEWIERERGMKGRRDLLRAVGSLEDHAFHPTAIEGQSENRVGVFSLLGIHGQSLFASAC